MSRKTQLAEAIKAGSDAAQLAEDYCLIAPSFVYTLFEREMIEITKEVASFFNVSTRSLQLCGSAKLGFSPIKGTDFVAGTSDLDVAVLDADCFCQYLELISRSTSDMQDQTKFIDSNHLRRYKALLSRGILRADVMPLIPQKVEWDAFFSTLSSKHYKRFSKISAAIYVSDSMFIRKQLPGFTTIMKEVAKL